MPRVKARFLAACALLSAALACGDQDLSMLRPVLEVREGTPRDPTDRAGYLLDFGDVELGANPRRSIYVKNAGRSLLTVQPLAIELPWLTSLSENALQVPAQEDREIVFVFRPAEEGPRELVLTLESDGGRATVRLSANGVRPVDPVIPDCEFEVEPASLDFGSVFKGSSRELSFRIFNLAEADCNITRLQLSAGGDSAFSLVDGAIASRVIPGLAELEVPVRFAPPTGAQTNFSGRAQFWIGPPDEPFEVELFGTLDLPCPDPLPDGSCPVATELVYAHTSNRLYSHDPIARTTKDLGEFRVGSTRLTDMTDIAIDNNGTMVGINSGVLYVIDPNTARCTRKGNYGSAAPGLTFLPDGRLVVSGKVVDVVDLNTGVVLDRLVNEGVYSTSGDIVGLPDGMLYWAVSNGDRLVRIDPNTKQTTLVGNIGQSSVFGMGYANGELYGYASNGDWLVIDHLTAKVKRRHNFSTAGLFGIRTPITWWGAATNPVRW